MIGTRVAEAILASVHVRTHHGVDAAGAVVLRKKLRRGAVLDFLQDLSPCLVGMEACASSHHWAREIAALGHEVRLIPPT